MTLKPLSRDDIVDSMAAIAPDARSPLIIRDRLTAFLDEHGLGRGDVDFSRVGHGHSYETFLLRRSGFEAIMRRLPRPPLTAGVHNIEREARILGALKGAARAPKVLALCLTGDVTGGPFIILERLPGAMIADELPVALDNPAERARIGAELVDALQELHACKLAELGLSDIVRSSIDHPRHIRSLRSLWSKNATRELPEMERLGAWLNDNVPPVDTSDLRIVHSDYRLGNVLFSPTAPTRLTGILDWETAIFGDPLIDLAFLIGLYRAQGDDEGFLVKLTPAKLGEGALTRAQMAHRYASQSGRSLDHFDWYLTFALWRTAVIGEGLYRRFLEGQTDDPFYRDFDKAVPELAERARAWSSNGFK